MLVVDYHSHAIADWERSKCAGFPPGHVFYGRDIAERVEVKWGTFSLVNATKVRSCAGAPLSATYINPVSCSHSTKKVCRQHLWLRRRPLASPLV